MPVLGICWRSRLFFYNQTRYTQAFFVTPADQSVVEVSQSERENFLVIEDKMIASIAERHQQFITGAQQVQGGAVVKATAD